MAFTGQALKDLVQSGLSGPSHGTAMLWRNEDDPQQDRPISLSLASKYGTNDVTPVATKGPGIAQPAVNNNAAFSVA